VCISVNEEVCHGIPGVRKLRRGDVVNIDVTVLKYGVHGDTSRMFVVGDETSVEYAQTTEIARQSLWRSFALLRPGRTVGDIGASIQQFVQGHNMSVVREYGGHGIGNSFHEAPWVPHYGTAGTGTILEEGMILTIEPMVNAGGSDVAAISDGWTIVTTDGRVSAQWEHTVLITGSGAELLTECDQSLLKLYKMPESVRLNALCDEWKPGLSFMEPE